MTMQVKNLPRKERDEVADVDQFKAGAQTTRVREGCPKCAHDIAMYQQLQVCLSPRTRGVIAHARQQS